MLVNLKRHSIKSTASKIYTLYYAPVIIFFLLGTPKAVYLFLYHHTKWNILAKLHWLLSTLYS